MGICSSNINVDEYIEKVKHEQLIREQMERGNLLRFKVEVMVNMLAMEEKKMEALTKRLEALKYILTKEGVSEQRLSELLKAASVQDVNVRGSSTDKEAFAASAVDLAGVLGRVRDEFSRSRDDIVQSFADEEGKIVPALSRDEFMRQLYASTEKLSKTDIQIVSLRFFDGLSVSIPEFIDFFVTPEPVRIARAAASAVRTSLDLLHLEQYETYGPDDEYSEDEPDKLLVATHRTEGLDAAVQQLLNLWKDVKEELEARFEDSDKFGSKIVLTTRFQEILTEVCGPNSGFVDLARRNNPQQTNILPLQPKAIDVITVRFEIGGRVHYGHFLRFFDEKLAGSGDDKKSKKPVAKVGASPFRMSSEWAALKAAADAAKSPTNLATNNVGMNSNPAGSSGPSSGLPLPPPRPPVPFAGSSSSNNVANVPPPAAPNGIAAVGTGDEGTELPPLNKASSPSRGMSGFLGRQSSTFGRTSQVPQTPMAKATPPDGDENVDPNTTAAPVAGNERKLHPPPLPATVPEKPGFFSRMMTSFGLGAPAAAPPGTAPGTAMKPAGHKDGPAGADSQFMSPDAKAEGKVDEFGDNNAKGLDMSADFTFDGDRTAKYGTPLQDASILAPRFDDSFDRAEDKGTPYAPTPAAKRMI